MKVTGLSGVTEISEVNIAYFYVRDDTVRIHYTDNSFFGLICKSVFHAMIAARGIFNVRYQQYATLCGIDGVSYYIKASAISSVTVSNNILTITLTGHTITIPCKDEATALWDKDYADAVKTNATFLDTFAGTWLEVGAGKTYATITAAYAAAVGGNAIKVFPGTYPENMYLLHNVPIYFIEGAKSVGGWYRRAEDAALNHTYRIYGSGQFETNDQSNYTGTDAVASQDTDNATLHWFFSTMKGNSYRPFFTKNCLETVRLKGGLYYSFGEQGQSFIDTDASLNLDLDIVRIRDCETATFVAYASQHKNRVKLRNIEFMETNGSPVIDARDNQFAVATTYGYEAVNCYFVNEVSSMGANEGAIFNDGENEYTYAFVRFYNCIFSNSRGKNTQYLINSHQPINMERYGYMITDDATYAGANVTFIGNAQNEVKDELGFFEQTSDSNINAQIMPLSSKPKKSKFQVGETVWYFRSGQLVSGVVKKTKTIMTNAADTADGEQNNLYAIGSVDADMIPESQVFRTRNMAIWKMANSSTRLNTILFNNIDASVDFNPDLSALDLSGCDMSTGVPDWTLVRLDGAKLDNTTVLPASVDTKEEMKAVIKSYDPVDSIWKDGSAFDE